jgi:hypothetical protein
MQGIVQGLFVTPPQPCNLCTKLGKIASTLQENFILVEDRKGDWKNIQAVYKLSFFDQVNRLFTLLTLFATTAISIDKLVRDDQVMGMLNLLV